MSLGAPHVTGRAQAHLDRVPPLGHHGKKRVKGHHAVNGASRECSDSCRYIPAARPEDTPPLPGIPSSTGIRHPGFPRKVSQNLIHFGHDLRGEVANSSLADQLLSCMLQLHPSPVRIGPSLPLSDSVLLNLHRAHLVFRDLGGRIKGRVGQFIGRSLCLVEGNENGPVHGFARYLGFGLDLSSP